MFACGCVSNPSHIIRLSVHQSPNPQLLVVGDTLEKSTEWSIQFRTSLLYLLTAKIMQRATRSAWVCKVYIACNVIKIFSHSQKLSNSNVKLASYHCFTGISLFLVIHMHTAHTQVCIRQEFRPVMHNFSGLSETDKQLLTSPTRPAIVNLLCKQLTQPDILPRLNYANSSSWLS